MTPDVLGGEVDCFPPTGLRSALGDKERESEI